MGKCNFCVKDRVRRDVTENISKLTVRWRQNRANLKGNFKRLRDWNHETG